MRSVRFVAVDGSRGYRSYREDVSRDSVRATEYSL